MRIRTIKPEFFLHEHLYDLEKETGLPVRLAFAGLWCAADREGRFAWEPRRLKAQILPYDDIDFCRLLDALAEKEFIIRYGERGEFGVVPSFKSHQHVNLREPASRLPAPDARARTCTHVPGESSMFSTPNNVEKPDFGTETETATDEANQLLINARADTCTHVHARVEGKGREGNYICALPHKGERPRNLSFDALVKVQGGDPNGVTKGEGGRVAKALKDIKETLPGLDDEDVAAEIHRRAGIYRQMHPEWTLTSTALAQHWSEVAKAPTVKPRNEPNI